MQNMIRRYRKLFALAAVPAVIFGCSEDYNFTEPERTFTVTPAFTGIDEGTSIQLAAVSPAGTPASVTWSSDNTAVITVNASGLAQAVAPGITAVIATSTTDPTQKSSSSITVNALQGIGIAKNQAVPISGAGGTSRLYRIFVPAGTTNLRITVAGGTGDVDLYVRRGQPPTGAAATDACRSFNDGNGELCSINNPQSGTWYMLLDAFSTYAGATLTATYTP